MPIGVVFSDTGGMKTVELYARVRRAVLGDGMCRRATAREFWPVPQDRDGRGC